MDMELKWEGREFQSQTARREAFNELGSAVVVVLFATLDIMHQDWRDVDVLRTLVGESVRIQRLFPVPSASSARLSSAVSDIPFPLPSLGYRIQTTFVALALPLWMKTLEGLVPARY